MKDHVPFVFAFLIAASPALADPLCSKLAWPLDKERALLQSPALEVANGSTLTVLPDTAIRLRLKPTAQAALPHASTKPGDPARFAGFVSLPSPPAGDLLVTLSSEAWIDLVQDGALILSTAHTGDASCPGLRKSVRFTVSTKPLTLEISDSHADQIEVVITRQH